MTLYTSEVVAQHLDVTERRVRQLRDEGIIREKRPGLYNLVDAMTRYIKYVNAGSKVDLNDERAKLTKVKREAAEMENRVRKAELMEVGDVEKLLHSDDEFSLPHPCPAAKAGSCGGVDGRRPAADTRPYPSRAGRGSGNSELCRRGSGRVGG